MTTLSIKPVTKGYFNKSVVSLRDIAVKRRSGVAILANRQNPDGTITRAWLIPEGPKSVTPSKVYDAVHMETKRKYGPHTIVDAVKFKFVAGILEVGKYDVGTRAYSQLMDETAVAFQVV